MARVNRGDLEENIFIDADNLYIDDAPKNSGRIAKTASRVQKIHNATKTKNQTKEKESLTQLFLLQLKYFDAKYCK